MASPLRKVAPGALVSVTVGETARRIFALGTVAGFVRRPLPALDLAARRPPVGRRPKAVPDAPPYSRIVLGPRGVRVE